MIVAAHLRKWYGHKAAVDDLSFEVRPGVVTGFLGPNGAGKSTTMRLMLGLDHGAGKTTFDGRCYRDLSHPLCEIGAVLEAKAFHPARSGRNHLRMLAAANGIGRGRVDEVLAAVGLSEVADDKPKGFSLGMASLRVRSASWRRRTGSCCTNCHPERLARAGFSGCNWCGGGTSRAHGGKLGPRGCPVDSRRRLVVTDALRFEWLRVRTIASTYWLVALAVVLGGLAAGGFAVATRDEVLDNGMAAAIYTGGSALIPAPFAPVFMAVLGILAVGHEYRHGTIHPALQAVPRRALLLTAKLLVVIGVSALTALVAVVVNGLLGAVIRGTPLPIHPNERGALAGYVGFVVLWAVLGLALALLLRSIPAAIVIILVVPLVVEPLVELLSLSDAFVPLREIVAYLPFSAGQQLPQATDFAAASGTDAAGGASRTTLSRWAGGGVFASFIAAILVLAWTLFEKRDA